MESSGESSATTGSPISSFQPSNEYLAISLKPSTLTTTNQKKKEKQLLILDLNGTLCVRSRDKKNFCVRPHLQSFFQYIFHNFIVMVWSSAREQSVDNMCNMFGHYQPILIWNRSHFNLTAREYYSHVQTLKDLNLVWDHLPEFNATNTIVLDDSVIKLAAHPYNLIKMSTFHNDNFLQDDRFMDRDLCKVANYLNLLKEQSNVCNFIRFVPFDVDLPWGTVPDIIEDRRIEYYERGRLVRRKNKSSTSRPAFTVAWNMDITLLLKKLMKPEELALYTSEAIKRMKELELNASPKHRENGQKRTLEEEEKEGEEDTIPNMEQQSKPAKRQRTEGQLEVKRLKNQRARLRKKERKAARASEI